MSKSSTAAAIAFAAQFLFVPQAAHAQIASASIQVSVTQPQPVAAGTNFDYVIQVNNEGPDDAANPSLSFPLPAGITFQSDIVPAGWTCTVGATVTCAAATLAPGTDSFTITASSPPTASGTFSTTATVSSTTPDPSDNDNSFAVDVIIQPSSDFSMALSASPDPVNAGTNLTWTMTVTNNGPSTAVNGSADLPLPAPVTFVSFTAPPGWSCTTPPAGANGTVTCSLTGTMNSGTPATITVVSNVPSSLGATTLSSTATVSSPDDSIPANDFATASVQSAVAVDLFTNKFLAPQTVAMPGSTLHYTIVVANSGPSDAQSVTMTDVLPAPLRFTSINATAGWSCTTPAVGANGTIVCSLPSSPPNVGHNFMLDVVVDPATPSGTVINNMVVVASSVSDSRVSDNSDTDSTIVSTPPNVTASKSAGAVRAEGSVITYTIVLTNSGSIAQADNPGNELTDVLPSSLTLIGASATSGTAVANIGTNTVTWNGSVPGNGSVTITIQASVHYGTAGTTISNQATVSYDSDANGTNDASGVSDDPSTPTPSDPTAFVVVGSVPALSTMMLALLGALLAAMALYVMKT